MVHPSPPLSPTESFNSFLGEQIHFPNVLVITVTIKLQIREMLLINICYATCKTCEGVPFLVKLQDISTGQGSF